MTHSVWPDWWSWELEFTPHIERRMNDRQFNEIDLRVMLERAHRYRPAATAGRWIIETLHRGRRWEIVAEPDGIDELLVLVTAYPVER